MKSDGAKSNTISKPDGSINNVSNITTSLEIKSGNPDSDGISDFSVSEIARLLQIRLNLDAKTSTTETVPILDLSKVRLELPRVVNKMTPIVSFHGGIGDWCVTQVVWEHATTPFVDRDGFLVRMRHMCEKLSKDLFCVYRVIETPINEKVTCVDPLDIGYDKSILSIDVPRVKGAFSDLLNDKLPLVRHDEVSSWMRVVMPPAILALSDAIQDFMFSSIAQDREWIKRFCRKKNVLSAFNAGAPRSDADTVWIQSSDPSRIYEFFGILPDINVVSIVYVLPFVMPSVEYQLIDASNTIAEAGINISKVSGMNKIFASMPTRSNSEDITKIIMGFMLPGQIMLEPQFQTTENSEVNFFCALLAKIIFSASPGCRNISLRGICNVDSVIGDFLSRNGFRQLDRANNPIRVCPVGKAAMSVAWDELTTKPNGKGWVNTNCAQFVEVNEPLYPNVTKLPQYGGVHSGLQSDLLEFDQEVTDIPIFLLIRDALESFSGGRNWREPMIRVLDYFRRPFTNAIGLINEHIILSGEVGMRMSFDDVVKLEMAESLSMPNSSVTSTPIIVPVDALSLLHFVKMPPVKLTLSNSILKQPMIESQLSAELQIIFAAYSLTKEVLSVEGMTNEMKNSKMMDLVLNNSLSNHFSKSMIKFCFKEGKSGRMNWKRLDKFTSESYDALEARFMMSAYRVILSDPELFGITRNIVRLDEIIHGVSIDKYQKFPLPGVLGSTCRDGVVPMYIPRPVFNRWLLAGEVLSRCFDKEHLGKIVLPVWVEYTEEIVTNWLPETAPIRFQICRGKTTGALVGETYEISKYTNQFLVPKADERPPECKDAVYINSVFRMYWHVGGNVHIREYDAPYVFGQLIQCRVRNWKAYVKFRHALEIV